MAYQKILATLLAVFMLLGLCGCGDQAVDAGPAEVPVTLGEFQGGTYTNTYAGFACTLGDGWTYLSAGELQELPDAIDELLAGSEPDGQLADIEIITDLKAENEAELTSLYVQYGKHSTAQMLAYRKLSEEQLVDEALKTKDNMIISYREAGIDADSIEKVTVQFAGQEHFALHLEATIQGVPYYTTQIFVYGKGRFGVTLTAASFITDKTPELLNMFTAP